MKKVLIKKLAFSKELIHITLSKGMIHLLYGTVFPQKFVCTGLPTKEETLIPT